MKSLVIVTALALSALAQPAFAARGVMNVPRCDSKAGMHAAMQLADQLKLDTILGSSIDLWNGCLKVTYEDDNDHTHIEFYDPDTLSLINRL